MFQSKVKAIYSLCKWQDKGHALTTHFTHLYFNILLVSISCLFH